MRNWKQRAILRTARLQPTGFLPVEDLHPLKTGQYLPKTGQGPATMALSSSRPPSDRMKKQ